VTQHRPRLQSIYNWSGIISTEDKDPHWIRREFQFPDAAMLTHIVQMLVHGNRREKILVTGLQGTGKTALCHALQYVLTTQQHPAINFTLGTKDTLQEIERKLATLIKPIELKPILNHVSILIKQLSQRYSDYRKYFFDNMEAPPGNPTLKHWWREILLVIWELYEYLSGHRRERFEGELR